MANENRPKGAPIPSPPRQVEPDRSRLRDRFLLGLKEEVWGPPGADVGDKWVRAENGRVSRPRWSMYAGYIVVFFGVVGAVAVLLAHPWSNGAPVALVVAAVACLAVIGTGFELQRRRQRMLAQLDRRLETIMRYRAAILGRVGGVRDARAVSSPLTDTLNHEVERCVDIDHVMENVPDLYFDIESGGTRVKNPNKLFRERFPGISGWPDIVAFPDDFRRLLGAIPPGTRVPSYTLVLREQSGEWSFWEAEFRPSSLVDMRGLSFAVWARPLSPRYDDLDVGVYHTNGIDDGKVIYCNPRFAAIVGMARDEIVKTQSMPDFYADPDKRLQLIAKYKARGNRLEGEEVDFKFKDATERVHVLISCKEDPLTKQVFGVVHDVSLLRLVVENPGVGVYVIQTAPDIHPASLDPTDYEKGYDNIRFSYANEYFRKTAFKYGDFTPEQFCEHVKPKDVVDDAFLELTYQNVVAKLSGRQSDVLSYRFAGVDKNDQLVNVEVQSRYVPSYLGRPAVVGFLKLLSVDEKLRGLTSGSAFEKFLRGVSHSQHGALVELHESLEELMRWGPDRRCDISDELPRLRDQAAAALDRYELLKAGARITRVTEPVDIRLTRVIGTIFDKSDFVIGTKTDFMCDTRSLKLGREIDCGHACVPVSYLIHKDYSCRGNPEALLYSLQQLVHNALMHLSPTAPRLYVEVSKLRQRVQVLIANNGDSIPNADRNNVFQIFHTSADRKGDAGFGLFSVMEFLTSMGANVTVQDPPGWMGTGTGMLISLERSRSNVQSS